MRICTRLHTSTYTYAHTHTHKHTHTQTQMQMQTQAQTHTHTHVSMDNACSVVFLCLLLYVLQNTIFLTYVSFSLSGFAVLAQYYMVSAGRDCAIRFWDIRNTHRAVLEFKLHTHWYGYRGDRCCGVKDAK